MTSKEEKHGRRTKMTIVITVAILLVGAGVSYFRSMAEQRASCMLMFSIPFARIATTDGKNLAVAAQLYGLAQELPSCIRYVATAYERIVENGGIPYRGTGL